MTYTTPISIIQCMRKANNFSIRTYDEFRFIFEFVMPVAILRHMNTFKVGMTLKKNVRICQCPAV